MQSFVTLPTEIQNLPMQLKKISSNVYYHESSKQFYKSSLLDTLTGFIGENLASRTNTVFTKYDPSFLILQLFAKSPEIPIQNIPYYLNSQMISFFANIGANNTAIRDSEKIMDFLSKRAVSLHEAIISKKYSQSQMIKVKSDIEENKNKIISRTVIDIMRKDVPEVFIEELVSTKITVQKTVRPILLDTFDGEMSPEEKDKKKKQTKSKPKPTVIPKNQPTLFGFVKKQ